MCTGTYTMNQKSIYDDPYHYEIDGEKQTWYCVLWYDGPLIWENESKTQILFTRYYTSQFEVYELYNISNDAYSEMIEQLTKDKQNGIRTNVQGTDVLIEYGILPKTYYSLHKEWEKLMPFEEDVLRETRPEIFI
jgi:hypothetical protein